MPGRKKGSPEKSPPRSPRSHPRGTIYCDPSLPEPAQCRQICYQLARILAAEEVEKSGPGDMTPGERERLLDEIALETTRMAFEEGGRAGQAPAKNGAAAPHPLIGRDLSDAPWLN